MIPKHLKNADPWALASFRYERESAARNHRDKPMSHAIVDCANALRNAIAPTYKDGRIVKYDAPYEIRDTKKGSEWGGTTITGHPQAARCSFCRKQVAAWGGRISRRRKLTYQWPDELVDAFSGHIVPCGEAWLRLQVARWATEQMTDAEARAFGEWRNKHAKVQTRDEYMRDPYGRLPPELHGLFDNLPSPPGSAVALEIEISLVAISRVWTL